MMRKKILIPVVLLFISIITYSQNTPGTLTWNTSLESAVSFANGNDKTIMLYFSGSDWCRPCIQLKEKVFNSEPFHYFSIQNLILVQIDFPSKSKNNLTESQVKYNESIAEKYNQSGAFPFIVLLNKKGEVLAEFNGYKGEDAESYIKKLEQVIKKD